MSRAPRGPLSQTITRLTDADMSASPPIPPHVAVLVDEIDESMTSASPEQSKAFGALRKIVCRYVGDDSQRQTNLDYYARMADQIARGVRTWETLTATIEGVRGISTTIAQAEGLKLLPVNPPSAMMTSGSLARALERGSGRPRRASAILTNGPTEFRA